MTGGFSDLQLFNHYVNLFPINNVQTSLNLMLLPVMGYNYLSNSNFLHIGVQVEVTSFILSATILKSLFAGILTSKIVMRKLALKTGMIPQKSEWLASLWKVTI